jgi:hypothetical protein
MFEEWIQCAGESGSGLKSLQRFLQESRVPFQRMSPSNDLIDAGGIARICLAGPGHHYVVDSMAGRTHRGTPPPAVRMNLSQSAATALHSR